MNYEPVLYRGIDFVLKTRKPVEALARELDSRIHHNQAWKGIRTIVMHCSGHNISLDAEIGRFCRIINRLSPQAMRCWKACSERIIDIGIDSGNTAYGNPITPLHLKIKPATLAKITSIKGELLITVYPYVNAPVRKGWQQKAAIA